MHAPRYLAVGVIAWALAACGDDGGGETGDAGPALDAAVALDGPAPVDASFADAAVPCSVGGVPGECKDVADCTGDYEPTPGFCPGPANIQCCTPVDAVMCTEADWPLPNDGLAEAPGTGGCPDGMLPIDAFCIDRYEAALVTVADGSSWSPYHNPGTTPVRAVSIEGAVPQGYITGQQAAAACAAAGKRLCTDVEWLRACRGPTSTVYPYGNDRMPGVCNDARDLHPAIEYFGTSDDWIWSMLGHPCLDQLPDSLAPTGSHSGCITAEGAYDMMGNLHEWTADPNGTFRGGFYVDTVINGNGCLYVTTAHNTLHWDYSTGFRCCADLP